MSFENGLCDTKKPVFELIETLRLKPDGTFLRLQAHLNRLSLSSAHFRFCYNHKHVEEMLAKIPQSQKNQRIRLSLAPNGKITVLAEQFYPLPKHKKWRIRIAKKRLCSSDQNLGHKTSNRSIFNEARSEFLIEEADEVIMLNERDEVCEGVRTNIFVVMEEGQPMITPPLSSGLLPGVLRQEMLKKGETLEKILLPRELLEAKKIFVGNSLHGLHPAEMGC